jgi:Predicted membrane protein
VSEVTINSSSPTPSWQRGRLDASELAQLLGEEPATPAAPGTEPEAQVAAIEINPPPASEPQSPLESEASPEPEPPAEPEPLPVQEQLPELEPAVEAESAEPAQQDAPEAETPPLRLPLIGSAPPPAWGDRPAAS